MSANAQVFNYIHNPEFYYSNKFVSIVAHSLKKSKYNNDYLILSIVYDSIHLHALYMFLLPFSSMIFDLIVSFIESRTVPF